MAAGPGTGAELESWSLAVRGMTGDQFKLDISKTSTVLDLKRLIHGREPSLPAHLQRLIHQTSSPSPGPGPGPGAQRSILAEEWPLSSCPGLQDGSVLFLVRLPPCELYVQDQHARQHTLVVPSSEPQTYSIALLRLLYEETTGQSMDVHQFQFRGRAVAESRPGQSLTLGDYGIKKHDSLLVVKIGFVLDVSNPQVDICFLVDCTGSMQGWIEAVKNNVKEMRDKLVAEYRGCDLRFAFVRYTDYDQPQSTRTTWLDFTTCQTSFHSFVGAIAAGGGGDSAEDIMGGLQVTVHSLSWRATANKVIIHIADCPCHGTLYHSMNDSYPSGDPAGWTHEHMMQDIAGKEIQYWFGYINRSYTDQMIGVFNEALRRLSDNRLMIRQFDAVQPAEIGEALHSSVTGSIYASEAAKRAASRSYILDKAIPDWSAVPLRQALKTPAPGACTLDRLPADPLRLGLEKPSIPFHFKCAANPFADGTESIVFHAYDVANGRQIVLKQFKRGAGSLESYMKVLESREIASAYATAFNSDKMKPALVDALSFAPVDVMQCTDHSCYSIQPFIAGRFEKFSNNMGVVILKSRYSQAMQAFSHYSWERSGKTLLVCDLQGAEAGGRLLLTDPALHSRSERGGRFGETDLGLCGIQRFFSTHVCGDTCHRLGLKPFQA